MDDSETRLSTSGHIITAIHFLAALEAQLRDSIELDAMQMNRYGMIVPPEVVQAGLSAEDIAFFADYAERRDLGDAESVRTVINLLVVLLQQHERTQPIRLSEIEPFPDKPHLDEAELRESLAKLGVAPEAFVRALEIAVEVHGQATRDDGTPYLDEHVFPIARDVASYLSSNSHVEVDPAAGAVLALLHDVLEDCKPESESELRHGIEEAYGPDTLRAVETLTKPPKDQFTRLDPDEASRERESSYMFWIIRAPFLVRLVKVFDRLNNLRCIHASPERDKVQRYLQESMNHHLPMASEIDPALAMLMDQTIKRLRALL